MRHLQTTQGGRAVGDAVHLVKADDDVAWHGWLDQANGGAVCLDEQRCGGVGGRRGEAVRHVMDGERIGWRTSWDNQAGRHG